jgi:hypothetical protein
MAMIFLVQASLYFGCAVIAVMLAHDVEVVAKLYEVHRTQPDAHVTVSNELRDQLARTLSEDERRIAVIKPERL